MNVFLLPHYSFTCLTSLSCKKMQRAEKDAFFMMHQLGMIINKIVKRMFWASSKSTKHFWKILARSRLNPIAICGNLKQAFSHIHIQEICRDSSKFHWIKDRNPQQTVIYIFTRLAFGLTLFALAATCQHHFEKYINTCAEVVKQIIDDLYVDDLNTGGNDNISNIKSLKETAIQIFKGARFVLHKRYPNCNKLE